MINTDKNLLLFGSNYSKNFKTELSQAFPELEVIPASIGSFNSGERFCELYPNMQQQFEQNKASIAGAKVHVVMNMEEDANLLMIDAINIAETLKEYGAAYIHLLLSFAPFARQDRQFDKRLVSIMGKTFPKHLYYAGVDEVTTFDMHSKASEQFFIDYFGEKAHFLSALEELYKATNPNANTAYAAPDGFDKPFDIAQGKSRKMTRMNYGEDCVIEEHNIGLKKTHIGPSEVKVTKAAGTAQGKDVTLIDDMGDTLGTIIEAGSVTKEDGALSNTAAFTHAILSGNSLDITTAEIVKNCKNPIDHFVFTDSILSVYRKVDVLSEEQKARVQIVPMLPLFKQALKMAM